MTLLSETENIIEQIEDTQSEMPKQLIEDFANRMDRIMGGAKTLEAMGADDRAIAILCKFSELCKATGYKASTLNQPALMPIFAAFWSDTAEMMKKLVEDLAAGRPTDETIEGLVPVLAKRLTWLAQQIIKLTKGSNTESSINVDGIMRKLGLIT